MPDYPGLRAKHPLAIRWFHWLNFPLLALMIWSGFLIYWAHDVYRIGWGSITLFHFFPTKIYELAGSGQRLAEGMALHFLFMWLFVLNGAAYVAYTAISGEWRELLPRRGTLVDAWQVVLHDLGIRKQPLPPAKFNGAQRLAYTGVVLMGAGSLVTGMAIYKPIQFGWITYLLGGYEWARAEHFALTVGYVFFFATHIAQVVRAGWHNFQAMVTGVELEVAE